jgi:hypothetical protein
MDSPLLAGFVVLAAMAAALAIESLGQMGKAASFAVPAAIG